jgi:uncharacterized protein
METTPSPFSCYPKTMKCTIFVTQQCNLSCKYCYIGKKKSVISLSMAKRIIDFAFAKVAKDEKIEFGFFGGEPLLEFNRIQKITKLIQEHKFYDANRVNISVVTNGTIFSDEIAAFLTEKKIILCVSCDGPAKVQNIYRRFPDGSGTSEMVERNLKRALSQFPLIPVNAVYSPENLQDLPEVIDYLVSLGAVNIYLNPNISADWTQKEADLLPTVYREIGKKYIDFYLTGHPKYINLIDGKITVILRDGYKPAERCRMGQGEFAFSPAGNIYPCERLVGSDDGKTHCLGNVKSGFKPSEVCKPNSSSAKNAECTQCELTEYCMNWCGCTNYYSTKRYDIVGPFMCASEKASISVALEILEQLKDHPLFSHHLIGTPLMNVVSHVLNEKQTHSSNT